MASSNIVQVDYDSVTKDLSVYFYGGSLYKYHNVDYDTYHNLITADSKGEFHNDNIKNNFEYTKVY